jgi:hypothetical protein
VTNEDADDIVDDWHRGMYPVEMGLKDVFVEYYEWTSEEYETWVRTAVTPDD